MTKRVTLTSDGDKWVFEEGKTATFTDRDGSEHNGDFTVTMISDSPILRIDTDLKGLSKYDWEPTTYWPGEYEIEDV